MFISEVRLELMQKMDISENKNDIESAPHFGIIHMAFGVETMDQVEEKSKTKGLKSCRVYKF